MTIQLQVLTMYVQKSINNTLQCNKHIALIHKSSCSKALRTQQMSCNSVMYELYWWS